MFHLGRGKRGDAGQSVPYIRENQPKVNVDNSKIFIFEGKIDPALKILTGNIPSSFCRHHRGFFTSLLFFLNDPCHLPDLGQHKNQTVHWKTHAPSVSEQKRHPDFRRDFVFTFDTLWRGRFCFFQLKPSSWQELCLNYIGGEKQLLYYTWCSPSLALYRNTIWLYTCTSVYLVILLVESWMNFSESIMILVFCF